MKEKGEVCRKVCDSIMNDESLKQEIISNIPPAKKVSKKKMSSREVNELLIENFVGLQKATTNLSVKFDGLADQISKLLEIFELSAKNFMKEGSAGANNDLVAKLDSLLEQNKTIAMGLVLIEDQLKSSEENLFPRQMPRPVLNQSPTIERQGPRPMPRI
jgi:hypothetical protein